MPTKVKNPHFDNIFEKDFANNFRKFRIKFIDKKQKDAAEKIGITKGHLSNIELNRYKPSLDLVDLLIKRYNLNIEWLTTGLGDMQTTGPAKPTAATSLQQAHTDIETMQKSMKLLHSKITTLLGIVEKQEKRIEALEAKEK